ncbi:MAG: hypothetical protein P1P81_03225 [Desulfobulbales bacterium]|nr:hypothetical protein [Desulfobulbales bacterium]
MQADPAETDLPAQGVLVRMNFFQKAFHWGVSISEYFLIDSVNSHGPKVFTREQHLYKQFTGHNQDEKTGLNINNINQPLIGKSVGAE